MGKQAWSKKGKEIESDLGRINGVDVNVDISYVYLIFISVYCFRKIKHKFIKQLEMQTCFQILYICLKKLVSTAVMCVSKLLLITLFYGCYVSELKLLFALIACPASFYQFIFTLFIVILCVDCPFNDWLGCCYASVAQSKQL